MVSTAVRTLPLASNTAPLPAAGSGWRVRGRRGSGLEKEGRSSRKLPSFSNPLLAVGHFHPVLELAHALLAVAVFSTADGSNLQELRMLFSARHNIDTFCPSSTLPPILEVSLQLFIVALFYVYVIHVHKQ